MCVIATHRFDGRFSCGPPLLYACTYDASYMIMGGVFSQSPQPAGDTSLPTTVPSRNTSETGARRYLSYFVPMPSPELIHSHSRPTGPATINAVVTLLTWRGLPVELAQRIVDQAQYWTKCTRTNKRACTVVARMAPPRQSSGGQLETWTSGQEDEVKEDMAMEGSGLRDRTGEVWYLCSSPVGCPLRQRNGGEEKDEMGASSWIRQVAVETFSRDQGWSDNAAHYGAY
jgi:hypothetical protein